MHVDVGQRKSLEKIEAVQEQVNDTSQAPLRMGGGRVGGEAHVQYQCVDTLLTISHEALSREHYL